MGLYNFMPRFGWCANCALIAFLAISVGVLVVGIVYWGKAVPRGPVPTAKSGSPTDKAELVAIVDPADHVQIQFLSSWNLAGLELARRGALPVELPLQNLSRPQGLGNDEGSARSGCVGRFSRQALGRSAIQYSAITALDNGFAASPVHDFRRPVDFDVFLEDGLGDLPTDEPVPRTPVL